MHQKRETVPYCAAVVPVHTVLISTAQVADGRWLPYRGCDISIAFLKVVDAPVEPRD